jgi:hypothetical protein
VCIILNRGGSEMNLVNIIDFLARVDTKANYTCGAGEITFGGMIPYTVSLIVTGIKIVVPILLVVFGLLDLAKAVMAQKEDEIKKGQQTLVKRFIAAIIVFFVVYLVQIVVKFASGDDDSIVGCVNCFVNGTDEACNAAGGEDDSL